MEAKKPTLTDYIAGGMLANGIVWIWSMFLTYLLGPSSQPNTVIILVSYTIYLLGGTLSSFLVCQRTTSDHVIVALKTVAAGWILTLFFMFSYVDVSVGTAILLFITFGIGGFIGAYLALKRRFARLRANFKASSEV